MKEFSKKLLALDYIITGILIIIFFICIAINGIYIINITNQLIKNGMEIITITPPLSLDTLGIVITAWISQLAISSGAYYLMCKSDHRIQLPMKLIQDMPEDVKENVDMTQIITTVLSTSDN